MLKFECSDVTMVLAYMVGNGVTGGSSALMPVMRWTANGPRWKEKGYEMAFSTILKL